MNRFTLVALLGLSYGLLRATAAIDALTDPPSPGPGPTPVTTPVEGLSEYRGRLTRDERAALSQAYDILSRSVAANPAVDPVFPDTTALRAAHRAALLCVWRGVLDNDPGKYQGLREALEGAVESRIGKDDIPLNPALQQEAAKAFADIAASLR